MRPVLSARVPRPSWLAALLLTACSSVPLPPDPATSGARTPSATTSMPPSAAPLPAPAPAAPTAVPAPEPPSSTQPLPAPGAPPPAPGATPAAAPWPPAGAQPLPLGTPGDGAPVTAWRVPGAAAQEAPAIVVVVPPDDHEAAAALAQAVARLGPAGVSRAGATPPALWLLSLAEPGATAPAGAASAEPDHLLLRSPGAAAVARLVREHVPIALVQVRTIEPWTDAPAAVRLARSGTPALHEFTRRAVDEWLRQPALDALARDGVAASAPAPAAHPGATLPDAAALRHVAAVDVAGSVASARNGALARAVLRVLEAAARRADDFAKVRRYVDQETAARPCGTQAAGAAGAPLRACGWWLAADAARALEVLDALGVATERVRVNETRLGQLAAPGGRGAVDAAVDLPAGSVFVPAAQPLADLAAALLEPASPTGLLAAGLLAPGQLARITAMPNATPAAAAAPTATSAPAPGGAPAPDTATPAR